MANPTWNVYVDLNGDGDFLDASEDISAYVMGGEFQNGFGAQYDAIGRDSTATIILRNMDKRFSPESGSVFSASWTRGKKIKIESVDPAGPTTRTMFVGKIKNIKPDPDALGSRRCTVICTSFFDYALGAESFVPVQERKTADEVIAVVIGNAAIYPPGVPVRWQLGVPGYGELGVTTFLGAASDWMDAEAGKTTFNYIGDKWGDGVSVYGALRDTVGREGGRLWLGRDGRLNFINRHHLLIDVTSLATFADSMVDMNYGYGDWIYNRVTVKAHPRKVSAAPEVLSRMDKAKKIIAGATWTSTWRYTDLAQSGVKIAGRDPVPPVQTTDYSANASEDGTGTDYTSSVSVTINKSNATGSEISFTNTAGVDVWIQPGAQVRATAIRDFGSISITKQDDVSILAYGLLPYTYQVEMDNVDDAEGMALYRASSWALAAGQIKTITLLPRRSAAMLTSALTREVMDRITVTETQTGASADYFIISEKHKFGTDKSYEVTWGLEPASSYTYWILGTATLGETTILGPY